MKIGCTLGGAHYKFSSEMKILSSGGVEVFQVFTGKPEQYKHVPPTRLTKESLKNYDYLIHSPYWFSFFRTESTSKMIDYLRYLIRHWKRPDKELLFVTHTSSFKSNLSMSNDIIAYERVCKFLMRVLPIIDGKLKIIIENDAGHQSSITPRINVLLKVKERFKGKVGICIDTEHAYSDGENILRLPYDQADVIHLNAIPPYVAHGGHLDRHSYTHLRSSKINMKPIINKIKGLDIPVILERYDADVIFDDIKYIKEIIK